MRAWMGSEAGDNFENPPQIVILQFRPYLTISYLSRLLNVSTACRYYQLLHVMYRC